MKLKKEPTLSLLFRILTLEEIQELTTTSRGEAKNVLDDIMFKELAEHLLMRDGALVDNILQFRPQQEEETESHEDHRDRPTPTGEISGAKGPALIIELKSRMQKSQGLLKGKEVLDLYKKLGQHDIEQAKMNKDDLKKIANSGILINKRQF